MENKEEHKFPWALIVTIIVLLLTSSAISKCSGQGWSKNLGDRCWLQVFSCNSSIEMPDLFIVSYDTSMYKAREVTSKELELGVPHLSIGLGRYSIFSVAVSPAPNNVKVSRLILGYDYSGAAVIVMCRSPITWFSLIKILDDCVPGLTNILQLDTGPNAFITANAFMDTESHVQLGYPSTEIIPKEPIICIVRK